MPPTTLRVKRRNNIRTWTRPESPGCCPECSDREEPESHFFVFFRAFSGFPGFPGSGCFGDPSGCFGDPSGPPGSPSGRHFGEDLALPEAPGVAPNVGCFVVCFSVLIKAALIREL